SGTNIASFTLANALLLRPLQVLEPLRLIRVTSVDRNGSWSPLIGPMVDEIHRANLFEGVCGFLSPQFTVEIGGHRAPMAWPAISGDCFAALGLRPAIGRVIDGGDDQPFALTECQESFPWPRLSLGRCSGSDHHVRDHLPQRATQGKCDDVLSGGSRR